MAVPHTVGSCIAWRERESAEDVFLTVIKGFVAGLPAHQLTATGPCTSKYEKSTGTRPDLFQHTVRITIKCL
jgi:hypothetical protein